MLFIVFAALIMKTIFLVNIKLSAQFFCAVLLREKEGTMRCLLHLSPKFYLGKKKRMVVNHIQLNIGEGRGRGGGKSEGLSTRMTISIKAKR